MAWFKLNKLHLHLSDDQGFRLEIKAYPKLTEKSKLYSVYKDKGGIYTQKEMSELINYAKKYHIEIIPEIDFPAHTRAITHAYPEFACKGDETSLYTKTRVLKTKLCLNKLEQVNKLVNDILAEVVNLFPSQYIHIGGDEVLLNSSNEREKLKQFYDNIMQTLQGKTVIGWEELMLQAQAPKNTIYQLWNNRGEYSQLAQKNNYPVILSPCEYTYFDHGYDQTQKHVATWCNKQGISMAKVLDLDIESYQQFNVIGIEGLLWGELVRTDKRADIRLWPRLIGIAQLAWSSTGNKKEILLNEKKYEQLMKYLNIYYYKKGIRQ